MGEGGGRDRLLDLPSIYIPKKRAHRLIKLSITCIFCVLSQSELPEARPDLQCLFHMSDTFIHQLKNISLIATLPYLHRDDLPWHTADRVV